MRNPLFVSLLLATSSFVVAEDSVSNAELSRKLDLILGKVGGLEQRVGQLESENKAVKKEVKEVAKSAEEAKSAAEKKSSTPSLAVPEDKKAKASFFQNLKNQIYSQEAKDSGPWAKEESWKQTKKTSPVHKSGGLWEIPTG